ncbi:Mitochondrial carrier domain-containing protein [Artemisia annua]|uniref:Mitochondrial carrier domain-containing protein n=1 Tax=Artemisia annua TaxID=35608 RepID=A0A2U1LN42_ARTAN|nr:Mitochondrial carrier domain-containing protein [Artemisia annua]
MTHLIDTVKTRIQSQAILTKGQNQKSIIQMVNAVWGADGVRGFYRGIVLGIAGSLATSATYFGVIESTKKWIEETHPNLGGHWAHFIA